MKFGIDPATISKSTYLGLGLHKNVVISVNKEEKTIKDTGEVKNIVNIIFTNANGSFKLTEWEPTDKDTIRGAFETGGQKPSAVEQLIQRINVITSGVGLPNKYEFSSFDDMFNYLKTAEGKTGDLKITKLRSGYVDINKYVSGVGDNGLLYLKKDGKFFGQNLILTADEAKSIEVLEASKAKPSDIEKATVAAGVDIANLV